MHRIAIIGTGFSGLCLGIQLKKAGIDSFVLFEKSDRVGGTWRENTYPGAACDSPSFAYCFSFEQKSDWSRKWAPQPEILEYIEHCVRKYDLAPHIRFNTEIEGARFHPDEGIWEVNTADGERIAAEILVSGVGQLNRPRSPRIRGLESFAGDCFHSARWDHSIELAGKDVAVIGNAASAIQFIPELAREVRTLQVFQRSANWMLPKLDREYTEGEKKRFARWPSLARLYRWWIWLTFELRFPVFRGNRFVARRIEGLAVRNMREQISDPDIQAALIPDYPIGGKRILISDDYYPALERDNVHLVLDGIDHVTPEGIVTIGGSTIPVDTIILATGFETTSFLAPMKIEGPQGQLHDAWQKAPEAYLGLTVAGFPNFFMMYGPNTNLGHNSIIFMLECQTQYIVDCLRKMWSAGIESIDLRPEIMEAYNRDLQRTLERSVWARTDQSWYKTGDGRITNNWCGTTTSYWWKTRHADLGAYHQKLREQGG